MTEIDAPLGEIVRSHLNGDPIARQNADAILFHTTRSVSQHFMSAFQSNAKTSVGQNFTDNAFEFDKIFLGQSETLPVLS